MIFSKRNIALSAAILLVVTGLLGCTKTEKRRTKSVDLSNVKMLTTDMNRPRVRVRLHSVASVLPKMAAVLRIQVDDGEKRYVLPAGGFAADSAAGPTWLCAPWLNTPRTGDLTITVAWADTDGSEKELGKINLPMRGDRFYDLTVMANNGDFCGSCSGCDGCQDYAIPAPLADEERDRLTVYWIRGSLLAPIL